MTKQKKQKNKFELNALSAPVAVFALFCLNNVKHVWQKLHQLNPYGVKWPLLKPTILEEALSYVCFSKDRFGKLKEVQDFPSIIAFQVSPSTQPFKISQPILHR